LTIKRSVEAEIVALRQVMDSPFEAVESRFEVLEAQLAAQREELRAHAESVAQEGWQYVLAGAACSAFATILALVG
jgi:hypothetical protein